MKENLQLEVDTIIQNSAGEVNSHQSSDLTRLIERKVLEGKIEELRHVEVSVSEDIEDNDVMEDAVYKLLYSTMDGRGIDSRIDLLAAQLNELEGRE